MSEDFLPLIHIYWDQGIDNAPKLVQRIVQFWKRKFPDNQVRVYDGSDANRALKGYDLSHVSLTLKSDIFRLYLLKEYGGLWVDATVLPGPSVNQWLAQVSNNDIFLFQDPGPDRMISNWLIYAKKGHPIVEVWLQELLKVFSDKKYSPISECGFLKKLIVYGLINVAPWVVSSPKFISAFGTYPYFVTHYTFARIIRFSDELRKDFEKIPYESASSPHRLQRLAKGNGINDPVNYISLYVGFPVHKLDWKSEEKFDCLISFLDDELIEF